MAILHNAISLYCLLLVARAIMSWFPPSSVTSPSVRQLFVTVYKLTEPVLRPVRQIMSPIRIGTVGFDFSIMVVILLLTFLNTHLH